MDEKGKSREEVEVLLREAHKRDVKFSDGRILGSMLSEPHEIARFAHEMFLEANLGNTKLYPGTKELEDRIIGMLGELLHGKGIHGTIVNGATEANITALWLAKKSSGKRKVLYPVSSHFSIQKALDLVGLEGVPIGLDDNYRLDISDLRSKLDDDTASVVAMAGSTELGVVDPISEIGELTMDKCFLHVDAAFGGMAIPFLSQLGQQMPDFDFGVPGVTSIAVDPHKMGRGTIPCGAFLVRDKSLMDNIAVDTPYLTMSKQAAMAGTRNSASVAAAYAVMTHLGRAGYRENVKRCMELTKYCREQLESNGFSLVIEPLLNIIAVHMEKAASVEAALAEMNWWVSKTQKPPALRLVIMPHVTENVINNFIPDLIKVCKNLEIR